MTEDRIARAREALTKCMDQFCFYVTSHRAKGTADGYAKAEVNQQMAVMCEEALAALASLPDDVMAEREAIVTYIRSVAGQPAAPGDCGQARAREIAATMFADAIERGDHLAAIRKATA